MSQLLVNSILYTKFHSFLSLFSDIGR